MDKYRNAIDSLDYKGITFHFLNIQVLKGHFAEAVIDQLTDI